MMNNSRLRMRLLAKLRRKREINWLCWKLILKNVFDFVVWSYLDYPIRMIIISKNDEQFLTPSFTKLRRRKRELVKYMILLIGPYLDSMMRMMNFPSKWRYWMSECLSTITPYVCVYGSPVDKFLIVCGSRQRQPLSRFLFLIQGEKFNSWVLKEIMLEKFCEFQVDTDKPLRDTHL